MKHSSDVNPHSPLMLPHGVCEAHSALCDGHVSGEEVPEARDGGGTVEGESHGAPVRIFSVSDAAVRSSVVAGAYQVLHYLQDS